MGLAALEVMQAVQRTWTNSKVRMNGKTRLMQWRDMFDIAVKWRRIADPDQPVLWLDQMPARSLSRGFNNHINLIRLRHPLLIFGILKRWQYLSNRGNRRILELEGTSRDHQVEEKQNF
nr:tetratricopeptide repeat protein 13-like [Pelodiscus sinensis]|eukprot:XP_006122055.1 tetratricopeptide repeat protein 13-like [Pelodiscus sinensis]